MKTIQTALAALILTIGAAQAAEGDQPSCKTDLRLCTSSKDIMNNYEGLSKIKSDCQAAANNAAEYGQPKWPLSSFSIVTYGASIPGDRGLGLFQENVQFKNKYDTYVRKSVFCLYKIDKGEFFRDIYGDIVDILDPVR